MISFPDCFEGIFWWRWGTRNALFRFSLCAFPIRLVIVERIQKLSTLLDNIIFWIITKENATTTLNNIEQGPGGETKVNETWCWCEREVIVGGLKEKGDCWGRVRKKRGGRHCLRGLYRAQIRYGFCNGTRTLAIVDQGETQTRTGDVQNLNVGQERKKWAHPICWLLKTCWHKNGQKQHPLLKLKELG